MLQIKDLSFDVSDEKGQKEIIQHLNLNLDEGKFVVITGPNGSGKSTLAKLIAGIEKPTAGKIFFDGTDITDCSITDRANMGISFALQQPVRFKGITVLDLLRLAAKKRLSFGEACNYLSEVGLCAKDYVNREVNASLSGGELKRIEIATVLATRGQKLECIQIDFGAVTLLAGRLVGPAAVGERTFNIKGHALVDTERFHGVGNLAPTHDIVPVRLFLLFTIVIAIATAGGKGERYALAACCACANDGVLADIADKHHFIQICHNSSYCFFVLW